jgi:hypothetical protein
LKKSSNPIRTQDGDDDADAVVVVAVPTATAPEDFGTTKADDEDKAVDAAAIARVKVVTANLMVLERFLLCLRWNVFHIISRQLFVIQINVAAIDVWMGIVRCLGNTFS